MTNTTTPASPVQRALHIAQQHAVHTLPVAVHHTQRLQRLAAHWTTRHASNLQAASALLCMAWNPTLWSEALQIQQAIQKRLEAQQHAWLDGFEHIAEKAAELKQANTMTKVADEQFSVLGQIQDLINQQSLALVTLQENIEVSVAYWLAQKAEQAKATEPAITNPQESTPVAQETTRTKRRQIAA